MSEALRAYFSGRYPARTALGARFWTRRGERSRATLIRSWLPVADGLGVLDAGCGDGRFLSLVLRGHPAHLHLQDFIEQRPQEASEVLRDRAERITVEVRDLLESSADPDPYDLVLACGVFDYCADWPALLKALLARTRGMLITDFPRRGTVHSGLRRVWLWSQGVRLHTVSHAQLVVLLRRCGLPFRLERLRLHWVVSICGPPTPAVGEA